MKNEMSVWEILKMLQSPSGEILLDKNMAHKILEYLEKMELINKKHEEIISRMERDVARMINEVYVARGMK